VRSEQALVEFDHDRGRGLECLRGGVVGRLEAPSHRRRHRVGLGLEVDIDHRGRQPFEQEEPGDRGGEPVHQAGVDGRVVGQQVVLVQRGEVAGHHRCLGGGDLQPDLGVGAERTEDLGVAGVERPGQRPVHDEQEQPAHHAVQLDLRRIGPKHRELLDDDLGTVPDQYGREQLELARPVQVHRALADARPPCDVIDGHLAVAEGEQQLPRRVEDA